MKKKPWRLTRLYRQELNRISAINNQRIYVIKDISGIPVMHPGVLTDKLKAFPHSTSRFLGRRYHTVELVPGVLLNIKATFTNRALNRTFVNTPESLLILAKSKYAKSVRVLTEVKCGSKLVYPATNHDRFLLVHVVIPELGIDTILANEYHIVTLNSVLGDTTDPVDPEYIYSIKREGTMEMLTNLKIITHGLGTGETAIKEIDGLYRLETKTWLGRREFKYETIDSVLKTKRDGAK